jgi:hypothetical protein
MRERPGLIYVVYELDDADRACIAAGGRIMLGIHEQVYAACRKAADDAPAPRRARAVQEGLELFDRMLPKEIIQLPVADDAHVICQLPSTVS